MSTKKNDSFPKELQPIKKAKNDSQKEDKKSLIKKTIRTIACVLVFFFAGLIVLPVFGALHLNVNGPELVLAQTIIQVIFVTILYFKEIKCDLKKIKSKEFLRQLGIGIVLVLGLKMVAGVFQSFLSQIFGMGDATDSTNQVLVEEYLRQSLVIIGLDVALFGPFAEEMVFRVSLKDIIKNQKYFIILSTLVFGFIHVIENPFFILGALIAGILINLHLKISKHKALAILIDIIIGAAIYIIGCLTLLSGDFSLASASVAKLLIDSLSYFAIGFSFAYIYQKSNNMFTSIGAHMANNLFSILLLALMGGLA
jgi:membrane protease YdiL (CAAX protease family)